MSSPLLVSGEVADGASSTPPTGYLTPRGAAKGRPVQLLAATSIQSQSAIATPATLLQAKQRTNLLSPLATDTSIVTTPYTQLTFNFNAFSGQPMMPHEALASSSNECSTTPHTRHSMLHSSDSADQLLAAPSNGEDGENDNNVDTSVHDEAFLELEQSMMSCRGTEVGSVFEEELTGSVGGDAPAEVCNTIDTEASVDKLLETAGSGQKNLGAELSSFDAQDSAQALSEPVFVVAEAASTGLAEHSELSVSEEAVSGESDGASNVKCSCADEAVPKTDVDVLNCETSNAGLGVSDAEDDETITETSCTSPIPCQTPSEGCTREASRSPTGVKTPSQSAIAVNTYGQSLQMSKSISQTHITAEKNASEPSLSNIRLSTNLSYTIGENTSLSPGIGMISDQAQIVAKDAVLPQVSAKDISQSQLSVGNISQSQPFVKDISQLQSSAMKISQSQIVAKNASQSPSAFNNTSLSSSIVKNINQPHVGMGTTPMKDKVKSAAMLANDLSPIVPDNLHAREIHQRSAIAKSTSEPVRGYDQRLDDLMSITLPSSQHASFNVAHKSLTTAIKPPSSAVPAANVSLPVISSTSRHMCISARNQLPARIEQRSMLTVMPTDNRYSIDAQQGAQHAAPPAEASTVCAKSHHRKHALMPQIGDRFPK